MSGKERMMEGVAANEIRHGNTRANHFQGLLTGARVSRIPEIPQSYSSFSENNGMWMDSKPQGAVSSIGLDEAGLSEHFYGMNLRGEHQGCLRVRPDASDGFGNVVNYRPFGGVNESVSDYGMSQSPSYGSSTLLDDGYARVLNYDPFEGQNESVSDYGMPQSPTPFENGFGNVVNYGPFESLGKNVCDYGISQSHAYRSSTPFGDGPMNSVGSDWPRGYLCESRCNFLNYDFCYNLDHRNYFPKDPGSYNNNQRDVQFPNPSFTSRRFLNSSQLNEMMDYGGDRDRAIFNARHLMLPRLASSVQYDRWTGGIASDEIDGVSQHRSPMNLGDSFLIPERRLNIHGFGSSDPISEQRKNPWDEMALQRLRRKSPRNEVTKLLGGGGISEIPQSSKNCLPVVWQPESTSLSGFHGYIYLVAKDQQGCRYLQRIFEERSTQKIDMIFNEIISRISELMMDPFGNYLVQKLLEVCSEEQRREIVHWVTKEPYELVEISLNSHGTRSVQKLIETVKGGQQIVSVIKALEPGFLDLIKDLNGNHVVQRCLQCFSNEDNKFIFDAAAKFCVEIATHRHGCCVLQQCIAHSSGEEQHKMLSQILGNGLMLAQDSFGNYVIQYIIEHKIPSAASGLVGQFKGKYVQLSTQKCSSHVVEKCLAYMEESRAQIVHELLSLSHFEQLLQDPFANYVIQSALDNTKGALRASLVQAVRPHTMLRTSPYCKRIFSQNLLKK